MLSVEGAFGIVLILATGALLPLCRQVQLRRWSLRNRERRVVAFASELGHARQARERMDSLQSNMAGALDASSMAVRDTHRAIADIPFSILERIPATRDGARQIRRIHDLASDGIYAGISLLAQWQKRRKNALPDPQKND